MALLSPTMVSQSETLPAAGLFARIRLPFWWSVAALLAIMAALQFTSVRQESQTADEGRQLISGYAYLLSGHFTMATEHPPLLKLFWAIPVWFLHPDPPHQGDPWHSAVDFLYANRVPADQLLLAARCSAIAISLLLGVAIAFWGKRYFGSRVALFAVFLYAADPNFLANGRYVKNDVGAALAIFAASMSWGAYLIRPTRLRLCLSAIILGLALTVKNSATILWLVLPLLYVVYGWQQRQTFQIAPFLRRFGVLALIAGLVIFCVYSFEIGPAGSAPELARVLPDWMQQTPIPALTYFRGLNDLSLRQVGKALEVSFLMGHQSPTGWWYMTPIAFAVKTPLADLILFTLALSLAVERFHWARLRELEFRWYLLIVPAAAYLAAAVFAHSNVGERHLLPLYPFLFVLASAALLTNPVPWRRAILLAVTGVLLVVETATIQPHYLAFFNVLAGGPIGGRRFLVDSNLDWGQDLKHLKTYLDANRVSHPCLSYYGWPPVAYYGIQARDLPPVPQIEDAPTLDCVAAISVTNLATQPQRYGGLDALEPTARIGYSIYVYDLRKSPK